MRIFLDTAKIDHIKAAAKLGIISGVTTNPSLIAKEMHMDYKSAIKTICGIVDGPVSVEVISEDVKGMLADARKAVKIAPNVIVKIPCTAAGIEATSIISKEGIAVNMTLIFSPNQGLLAALAGAAYASPFVGRLDDVGQDGMQVIKDMVDIYKNYGFNTQVIAASIRSPLHCVAAAKAGAHIATVPYNILMQMIVHPLTDIGIARFMSDWKKLSQK
jgi:transaldolase